MVIASKIQLRAPLYRFFLYRTKFGRCRVELCQHGKCHGSSELRSCQRRLPSVEAGALPLLTIDTLLVFRAVFLIPGGESWSPDLTSCRTELNSGSTYLTPGCSRLPSAVQVTSSRYPELGSAPPRLSSGSAELSSGDTHQESVQTTLVSKWAELNSVIPQPRYGESELSSVQSEQNYMIPRMELCRGGTRP